MLRIIAGKYKGSLIEQPDKNITRSTTDRVRESIFNCIQNNVEKAIVLDLFSGSGAMAIESISRGSMKAICVDNSRDSISIINKNINKLLIENIDIYNKDALEFLVNKKGTKYDLIFLDPPYIKFDLLNSALKIMEDNFFLNTYGKIVIETNEENFKKIIIPKKFIIDRIKKYGNTIIILINNIL
ncbi:MAG: 16S rRNA (guanine(966)-N(2))-methyltransferase RsmD [Mycoplasmataceae bacterium]|nr:16S rRNA (guanine(966)-N(2))-methyltransferase RsmD [Mycoplasmataceae bacterium]